MINSDIHTFVAEVVWDGQALDASPVGQAVADEVHVPDSIDGAALKQRHAIEPQALLATALAHRQVGQLVEPIRALVVGLGPRCTQQVGDAPVAEAPPLASQQGHAMAHRLVVLRAEAGAASCRVTDLSRRTLATH